MRFERFQNNGQNKLKFLNGKSNKTVSLNKHLCIKKKLFFHGSLSVTGFKKALIDKKCFAFNTFILASRKLSNSSALRKHYFQCRLPDQNIIRAKQHDFSTFYAKARTFSYFTQNPEVHTLNILLQKL